jgi:hypothetical protein
MILRPVGVAILTTEIIMNVTVTFAYDFDELLDLLNFDLLEYVDVDVEDEDDDGIEYDEDGIAWYYDEELDATFYFDEDLEDWAEVDEDGVVWCVDESGIAYWFDDESDDWVEYDESEDEEDDASAW